MDCSGEKKREHICHEYNIEVVGCFKLFGGKTVISDAGGQIITDKYYLFKCIHKVSNKEETIKCGLPTAMHICKLTRNNIPEEFNPFKEESSGASGGGSSTTISWDKSRRQLYNAIMLFITKFGTSLKPNTTIFKVRTSVMSNKTIPVLERDVKSVNTILSGYHTNMSSIINEFKKTREVRDFRFDLLEDILSKNGITDNNYS